MLVCELCSAIGIMLIVHPTPQVLGGGALRRPSWPLEPFLFRVLSHLPRLRPYGRRSDIPIHASRLALVFRSPPIPQADPPPRRIHRSLPLVEPGPHVGEKIPHVADHDAQDLVPRHRPMHHEAKGHEHPGQIGRGEDEQAHEAEPGVRVAPAPDVDEGAGEGGAEEGQRTGGEEGRGEEEERAACVEEEPGEGGWGWSERGLEQARVPLQEEEMEEQV
jgi:hypothetical protein